MQFLIAKIERFFWRTHFLTSEQLKTHMEGPTTLKKIRVIYTLTDWEMERYKTRSTVVFYPFNA